MLDPLDKALLERLQQNNQATFSELSESVGLSISAVRRRVNRLRSTGVIEADVSIVAPSAIGIQAVVEVIFENESVEGDEAFREQIAACPEVSQCYAVSGDIDYILIVHLPNLGSYEEWGKRVLMSNPQIRRYQTHLVWKRVKFTTALPVRGPE